MEGVGRLLLLTLGLLLASEYYVYAVGNVRLYGDNIFNSHQDMSGKLEELKRREAQLEREMGRRRSAVERMVFEIDIQNVKANIAHMEATLRVPYKDYLRSMSEQRQQFEREKAEMRKKLVEAENKRIQAVDALTAHKQGKNQQIGVYRQKLDRLTAERNKIAEEYAKFTEAYYEQEQKMKEERDRLLAEEAKLQRTLDEAKSKHAQALEAVTEAPTESYKPTTIPEQDEINKLRTDITRFNGMKNRKQLKEGLETTRIKLQELLHKLYKAGRFSISTTRKDLENALNEMESNAIEKREEQDNLRKELLEKIKQKDLTKYNEEEIASLKKTNQDAAALDIFQKEIARRSACLKGILEVSDLIKECSDAIRDVNERNLANMWADAIQEAKDSPLAKMWADAVNEAKDSDFARAWADAMQDANSNITKAWTDAIQGIKNSPLAKMWADAVKNAKSSPFCRQCSNAFQDAKKTISKINIIK